MTAKQLKETGLRVQDKANDLSNKVLDGSVKFSIAVDNKAKQLYEKHKDKSWAKKISNALGKKVDTHNRAASMEEGNGAPIRSQSGSPHDKIVEEVKQPEPSIEDEKVQPIIDK